MKDYVVHNGKVEECNILSNSGKLCCVKILTGDNKGTSCMNINSAYLCDKNGKSHSLGEYLNWRDRKKEKILN